MGCKELCVSGSSIPTYTDMLCFPLDKDYSSLKILHGRLEEFRTLFLRIWHMVHRCLTSVDIELNQNPASFDSKMLTFSITPNFQKKTAVYLVLLRLCCDPIEFREEIKYCYENKNSVSAMSLKFNQLSLWKWLQYGLKDLAKSCSLCNLRIKSCIHWLIACLTVCSILPLSFLENKKILRISFCMKKNNLKK